jgi:hypothetical protein
VRKVVPQTGQGRDPESLMVHCLQLHWEWYELPAHERNVGAVERIRQHAPTQVLMFAAATHRPPQRIPFE